MSPSLSQLSVGEVLATRTLEVDRARLVRYAGASGDFNPIHWNERFALVSVVTEWAGDPGAVVDYQSRFARPVPVPDPGSVSVEVTATVGAIDAEQGTARVDLTVVVEGQRVLAKAQALVRLPA
jgi:acyl dehydratase